jgi:type IV secretory pathway TrbL component
MATTGPEVVREEAERLVAGVLARARLAVTALDAGAANPLGAFLGRVLGHDAGADGPSAGPAGSGGPTAGPAGSEASTAAGGSTAGCAECRVCPLCRAMAALRDPSPEFAERLAAGMGDLAVGVAGLLRAFATATSAPTATTARPTGGSPARETAETVVDHDAVWRAATRTGHDSQPVPEREAWAAATADDPRPSVPGSRAPQRP